MTPPSVAAAPIMAYSPGVTHVSFGEQNSSKKDDSRKVLCVCGGGGGGGVCVCMHVCVCVCVCVLYMCACVYARVCV